MRLPGALKQPLPYFVLLGTLVFLVDAGLRATPNSIDVSPEVRREVRARLEQTLSRPATPAELERGLAEWVDSELLFREATKLGLDQNDSVIHEHLAQKLKHIVQERTVLPEPTEAELRAELSAKPERYTGPVTFDVTHVFISRSASGAKFAARVQEALAQLARGAEPRSVGDHFPRGPQFRGLTRLQYEPIFQANLGAVLRAERMGIWQTLESARGAHLLRLDAVSDGKPSFEALRPALRADVLELKKQARLAAYLKELRKKYALDAAPSH